MLSRSLFATSLLSLCLGGLVAVGCAAPTADTDEESVAESEGELSTFAQQLVGKYYSHATAPRQFGRLTLNANGTYAASIDITDVAFCITSPCLGPEQGTWNASKVGGQLRLRLRAQGQASRYYDAQKTAGELKLTRNGSTQTLVAMGANACLDDADCKSNEACGPKYCLMYCAANDPFCCGPSTCQPKNPPPLKKICGGIAGLSCGPGETCVDDPSDGCDEATGGRDCSGICVASAPPPKKICGGFAGIPCGAGEECVDDPTDSCDPTTGGADCSGICVAK